MYAIKAEIPDPAARVFDLPRQRTMYGGKRIAAGDTVYVFASENEGGSGLVARGVVVRAVARPRTPGVERQTPAVDVTIRRTALAKRPLGRRELRPHRDWDDGRAETELNFKLYRQATNKIVGLSAEAATFLESHFDDRGPAKTRRAAVPRGDAGRRSRPARRPAKPRLLAGGNPQIAKADGDAAVQAYIAAMPGWKRDVGRRLDALAERTVPGVRKAVRWNSPFYGTEDRGWFLGVHCLTRYVKVAFFRGTSLRPLPPVASKVEGTRYFHVHEGEALDEALVADWIRQAAALPGWAGFRC